MTVTLSGSRQEKGWSLPGLVRNSRATADSPVGLTSLPESILSLIITSLPPLDRFRLKLVGNHFLTTVISSLPRPPFKAYIAELEEQSKERQLSNYNRTQRRTSKTLQIACEEGYDALVLKLLHRNSGIRTWDDMTACLIAAIECHQESVGRILLRLFGNTPSALLFRCRIHGDSRVLSKAETATTALRFAVSNNSMWAFPSLLNHIPLPASIDYIIRALEEASERGYEEAATMLSGLVPRSMGNEMSRSLKSAAQEGHEGIVKILLDRGAKMPRGYVYPRATHLAAKEGHEGILRLLLAKDPEDDPASEGIREYDWPRYCNLYSRAPQNFMRHRSWYCLHFAIYGQRANIVEFLLENKIVPQLRQHRATALPLAAACGYPDIVKLLLYVGFDTEATLTKGSALELAAWHGNAEVMAMLLDAGATVGWSDLFNAVASGSAAAVSLLLNRGASIRAADKCKQTALHVAARHGHPELIHLLLKSGACIDEFNNQRETPLMIAVRKQHVECVAALLEHGANTNLKDCEGCTPTHLAASNGNIQILEKLHAAGASIHARDARQWTALHYAADKDKSDAILALLRWGLDIEARNEKGETPLHLAPAGYTPQAYEQLVSQGADPQARNNSGESAATFYEKKYRVWYYNANCA
ncbi:ankyrin repeat-containing domain protein [Aspergillus lucknowensis]|uniref:Ankyrin repeat-containing domain protein n=1 Tax=Aspergillus lucknowensis TaxID=176173 RepID=A0ABR4LSA0_9EURO